MKTKAGIPIVTIIIIAIVAMVIATILIFLMLPSLEGEYGTPGPCDDTCYKYVKGTVYSFYKDCEHSNRYIQQYHEDNPYFDAGWYYHDGFEGYTSETFDTLLELRQAMQVQHEGDVISEGSWHWFDCTAEAIS